MRKNLANSTVKNEFENSMETVGQTKSSKNRNLKRKRLTELIKMRSLTRNVGDLPRITLPSTDPRLQIPKKFLLDSFNNADFGLLADLLKQYCIEDVVEIHEYDGKDCPIGPDKHEVKGHHSVVELMKAWFTSMPDIIFKIIDTTGYTINHNVEGNENNSDGCVIKATYFNSFSKALNFSPDVETFIILPEQAEGAQGAAAKRAPKARGKKAKLQQQAEKGGENSEISKIYSELSGNTAGAGSNPVDKIHSNTAEEEDDYADMLILNDFITEYMASEEYTNDSATVGGDGLETVECTGLSTTSDSQPNSANANMNGTANGGGKQGTESNVPTAAVVPKAPFQREVARLDYNEINSRIHMNTRYYFSGVMSLHINTEGKITKMHYLFKLLRTETY